MDLINLTNSLQKKFAKTTKIFIPSKQSINNYKFLQSEKSDFNHLLSRYFCIKQ